MINIIHLRKDPLYKNSFFLMLSRFLNAGIGLIFWIIAAKFYSVEDVGMATSLIASLGIIMSFSKFGFDFSLIRYVSTNDKAKVFNTSLMITTIASLIVGIIYIGIIYFSSSVFFIKNPNYILIFLVFVIMNSIVEIVGVTFTAIRKADYYLVQNSVLASRVPLLIPLSFLGSFGIFGSIGLAFIFAGIVSILYVSRYIKINFKIDRQFLKESFRFSLGNYLSNVFFTVPVLILPILVLNLLGEADAAKYYIAFAIGNLVLTIPTALCTSLFVEGSHGENMKKNVMKTVLTIYSILIPMVVFIYFFGGYLLGMIGKDYVGSIELLRILVLSSLLVAMTNIFVVIYNVKMRIENNVRLNLILFLLLPSLSYFLIPKFGIVGVGYAMIVTYMVMNISIAFSIKKTEWKYLISRVNWQS